MIGSLFVRLSIPDLVFLALFFFLLLLLLLLVGKCFGGEREREREREMGFRKEERR